MSPREYFGEWFRFINLEYLQEALSKVSSCKCLFPNPSNIFKAFEVCPFKECTTVLIFQDPYPQKDVATGIALGNNKNTPENKLSPSLKILKDCIINLSIPHNSITFDNSLEDWAKQGVLLLNSALTCEINNIGSHVNVWRKFIADFITKLSKDSGRVYALLGKQAQTLEPYISKQGNLILKTEHPAYFARANKDMPRTVFNEIDKFNYNMYNKKINWFYET